MLRRQFVRLFLGSAAVFSMLYGLSSLHGDELGARITGPHVQYDGQTLDQFADSWIHLKFVEGTDIRLTADVVEKTTTFIDKNGRNLDDVNQLLADADEIKPTFDGDREQFRVYKALAEARTGVIAPDLGLWFNV